MISRIFILNDNIEGAQSLHYKWYYWRHNPNGPYCGAGRRDSVSLERYQAFIWASKKFDPFFVQHTYQISSKIISHFPWCFFNRTKMMVPFCQGRQVEGFENKQPKAWLCFTLQISIKTFPGKFYQISSESSGCPFERNWRFCIKILVREQKYQIPQRNVNMRSLKV